VTLTRRELLEIAGASVVAATVAPTAFARRPDRPNVLVVVIDTLRADHVRAYGGRAATPTIDALAREGLRFSRFFPEAMATIPARRSILTGRRTFPFRDWHRHSELVKAPGWEPIADVDDTVTSTLRRAGWWTGYVTDNPFLGFAPSYAPLRSSFSRFVQVGGQLGRNQRLPGIKAADVDRWLIRELRDPHIERRLRSFLAASGRYWEDETRSWAARVSTAGVAALDEAAANRPFALVVDTFEPHEPWTPPRAYIDLYGDPDYRGPEPCTAPYRPVSDYLEPDRRGPILRRMRDIYAAEVTMTDHWLAVLFDRLRALGLERETIVVLVSDHGHLLGEYGWTGKISAILHPPLIQVPFILVDPKRRAAGTATDWFAQTHDIGPTLLDMTGVKRPGTMDGTSLVPLLSGKPPRESRTMAYGGYSNWHYLRNERWAYVGANTGRKRRLYDLKRDPEEGKDVARDHPRMVDALEERVLEQAGGSLPSYDERGRLRSEKPRGGRDPKRRRRDPRRRRRRH
jgi:arylsulfatase A-like enzyme